MPSTIICPNCRRPQEESGRLTCPDCSAILPSTHSPASAPSAVQARPAAAASSALDEFTIPQRPTGAMTLLRNDLRSEDKTRQPTGWLDNIIPTKKAKDPLEAEATTKPKAIREATKPSSAPAHAPDSAAPAPELKAKPQPRAVAAPVAAVARVERTEPASLPFEGGSPEADSPLNNQVPIVGVVTGVVFGLLALIAILQGKQGWLGLVILATAGILASAILGIWNRTGIQKAFWQGFAVFGITYLAMAFVPTFPKEAGLELPTNGVIRFVHAKLTGTPEDSRRSFEILNALPVMAAAVEKPIYDPEAPEAKTPVTQQASFFALGDVRQFTVVGHCVFTLLFALAGSALSRWFFQGRYVA